MSENLSPSLRDYYWSPKERRWVPKIKAIKRAKSVAERVRKFRERDSAGVVVVQIELWRNQIEQLIARGYLTEAEAKDKKSVQEAFDDFARMTLSENT